jgi:membrane protease YdiL (CAAX protease family)
MAIFAAPLAEETFFRGWLQVAIGIELPARWRAGAFAIAAFAFAAVHPAPAFPVVFVFGLGAGWLFRRSGALLPGMIAHATHNAMAIFMAAS